MKHRFFTFSLFIAYITVLTLILILQGNSVTPARYILILPLGSLLVKKARNFVLDWAPFLFILISYDFLRGFAGMIISQVRYTQLYQIDYNIFQAIPNLVLQKAFFHPSNLAWYDYLATILYFLHFILPIGFGFLLWQKNKRHFREFVTGISLLSYAAWVSYLFFPSAPPWLASQEGYLPGINKVMYSVLQTLPLNLNFPVIYHNINPNLVGSIPSLHAAYPLLIFLFARRFFKAKALFFLPYMLGVWISIVYLGEHFVVDVIAGVSYALFFYIFSVKVLHRINWHKVFSKINQNQYLPNINLSKLVRK